jgi:hypothetical protein
VCLNQTVPVEIYLVEQLPQLFFPVTPIRYQDVPRLSQLTSKEKREGETSADKPRLGKGGEVAVGDLAILVGVDHDHHLMNLLVRRRQPVITRHIHKCVSDIALQRESCRLVLATLAAPHLLQAGLYLVLVEGAVGVEVQLIKHPPVPFLLGLRSRVSKKKMNLIHKLERKKRKRKR